jgi:hypothetical protein
MRAANVPTRNVNRRLVLAAAVFAHGMAEFGNDGSAVLGEHEGDGERRASAELAQGSVLARMGMIDRTRHVEQRVRSGLAVWV